MEYKVRVWRVARVESECFVTVEADSEEAALEQAEDMAEGTKQRDWSVLDIDVQNISCRIERDE